MVVLLPSQLLKLQLVAVALVASEPGLDFPLPQELTTALRLGLVAQDHQVPPQKAQADRTPYSAPLPLLAVVVGEAQVQPLALTVVLAAAVPTIIPAVRATLRR